MSSSTPPPRYVVPAGPDAAAAPPPIPPAAARRVGFWRTPFHLARPSRSTGRRPAARGGRLQSGATFPVRRRRHGGHRDRHLPAGVHGHPRPVAGRDGPRLLAQRAAGPAHPDSARGARAPAVRLGDPVGWRGLAVRLPLGVVAFAFTVVFWLHARRNDALVLAATVSCTVPRRCGTPTPAATGSPRAARCRSSSRWCRSSTATRRGAADRPSPSARAGSAARTSTSFRRACRPRTSR